ncbi:parcas [Carabus blaptoides fortunei]
MESLDVLDESQDSGDLDPRIQVELENLNSATDDINKLEIELDEANTTFRMLLNESTRRLKVLAKKLGSCIERARPYYDAVEVAKRAQMECQKAAVLFQRANEIHAAAKETVALAEQRFMSNQHEWQFDNAWQEMLNHATIKVMDAENQKAASGREHQLRATLFTAAEQKVQHLEERLRRHIIKSRAYFEEKTLCQDQLNTQKQRIESLQRSVSQVKFAYAQSLKKLESISEEIHQKRRKLASEDEVPQGPREPGVGAELNPPIDEQKPLKTADLPDIKFELDRCEIRSLASSAVSEKDDSEDMEEDDLTDLKQKVKQLATRPIDGVEGCSSDHMWESELNATVNKLDHMLLMKECAEQLNDHYKMAASDNGTSECNNVTEQLVTLQPHTCDVSGLVVESENGY